MGASADKVVDQVADQPVVLVHGLLGNFLVMSYMKWQLHWETGKKVINCEVGNGSFDTVLKTIDDQAKLLQKCIQKHDETKNGFQLIGHSNGGLLARHFIEFYNTPKVTKFISLAGPLGGFYCDDLTTCFYGKLLPDDFVTDNVYTKWYQENIGPTNYWRDPHQLVAYRANSASLALLNNERSYSQARKDRFLSVNEMVFFGSSNDGTIQPWQSTWFGVFAKDSNTKTVAIEDQDIYKNDNFGLKTMVEQGRARFIDSGLVHIDYLKKKDFIRGALSDEVGRLPKNTVGNMINGNELTLISVGAIAILVLIVFFTVKAIMRKISKKQVIEYEKEYKEETEVA